MSRNDKAAPSPPASQGAFSLGLLFAAIAGCGLALVGCLLGKPSVWQPAAVFSAATGAIGIRAVRWLRPYQFAAWIVAVVVGGLIYPTAFLRWPAVEALGVPSVNLQNKTLFLLMIQLVMFGMGTQMGLKDFTGLGRMWYGVLIGTVLQFTVMPLTGYALARLIGFPPEIGAGVVLIGSCSSGLASNVMSYLAGANLPLSIALTSLSTVIAPLMTPIWMKLLAGQMIEVRFWDMMIEIVKLVVVPIGAALLHDYLKHAGPSRRRIVTAVSLVLAGLLAFLATGGWQRIVPDSTVDAATTRATLLELAVSLSAAWLVGQLYHELFKRWPGVDRWMPTASMFGIVFVTAATTAAGRDALLSVGPLLLLAVFIHNGAGYVLAYSLSKLCGLDESSARTVAFEVGLQNGGMASGIARSMNKLGTVGLAAAVFIPWMNISGSILANYWRKRLPKGLAAQGPS